MSINVVNRRITFTSGAAWTPASVTTAFWYKADAGAYTDAGITLATNGQTVQQWNDFSGNGRHLINTTTGQQPTYTTSALNSLPGLHFINNASSSTNNFMKTAAFTLSQPFTIVYVFKNSAGGPNTFPGGMDPFAILLDGDLAQAGSRFIMFGGRTDTTPANRSTYYAGTGIGVDTTIIFAANTAYHYAVVFNGASSSSDINGTTTTGSPGSFGVSNGLSISSLIAGSNAIDAYVCEIFCMLSTTDLANALAYVSAKWGV